MKQRKKKLIFDQMIQEIKFYESEEKRMAAQTKKAPAMREHQQGANKIEHFQYSSKSTINPEEHLDLVRYLIHKYYYYNTKEEFEDLFQEGCIGLVRAVKVFDSEKGTKFATLANVVVRNSIGAYLRKKKRWDKTDLILDRPIQQERSDLTFLDILEDTSIDFENEIANRLTDRPALKQALTRLSARELQVIHMRYFENCLQRDIAKKISVSQSMASKIISQTISKLRHYMEVAQ